MSTKCIKLAIEYIDKENKLNKKDFFKELKDIQYKSYLACNRAMTYFYTNDMQTFIQKEIGLPVQKDVDVYSKSFKAWVGNRMTEILTSDTTSYVSDALTQFVSNR